MLRKGDIVKHNRSGNLKMVVTSLKKDIFGYYYNVVDVFRHDFSYDKEGIYGLSQTCLENECSLYRRKFIKVRRLQ